MRRTFKARRMLLDSSFITRSIFASSSGGSLAGAGGSARAGSADFRAATVVTGGAAALVGLDAAVCFAPPPAFARVLSGGVAAGCFSFRMRSSFSGASAGWARPPSWAVVAAASACSNSAAEGLYSLSMHWLSPRRWTSNWRVSSSHVWRAAPTVELMDGSNGSPVRARCVAVLPLPPSPRMPRRPRRKGTPFCALCTAWRIASVRCCFAAAALSSSAFSTAAFSRAQSPSSSASTSGLFFFLAMPAAVMPSVFFSVASAPAFSSSRAAPAWPSMAAYISAVALALLVALTLARWSRRYCITPVWP
mmetsp:Transcript_60429/g.159795  ORF Transcript_60429/g.159795 Transcript_60429/m.159795 type:complete len:306 (+) Transcript_60429:2407-3324(+)